MFQIRCGYSHKNTFFLLLQKKIGKINVTKAFFEVRDHLQLNVVLNFTIQIGFKKLGGFKVRLSIDKFPFYTYTQYLNIISEAVKTYL